jgi:hypothetical protein
MVAVMLKQYLGLLLLGLGLWAVTATARAEHERLGFDRLAGFPFAVPPWNVQQPEAEVARMGEAQIPAEIKAYHGRAVAVTGYMLPVRMSGGLVTEFLLVSDPMHCCFGATPNMNEWIIVRMRDRGVAPLLDIPVVLRGVLRVGALFENGYFTGIYAMEGERVTPLGG